MPPKGKAKAAPKAAAPAAKPPAAKTKGSPAKGSPAKGSPATPGPPTPPRPLPMPPLPPDDKKVLFKSLMEKKLMEWDKMMDKSKKIDERNRSLDAFRQLSDDEVDLATTEVYRKQFKDLINTKFDCFDQLARETDARRRCDEIKKFEQVCEDELSLAKALGPRSLFLREEQERQDKLAKQQEKAVEEKRKTAEKQTQAGGKPQMIPESMRGGTSYPATVRGRMMSLFPEMCAEEQAATAIRAFTMEQRLNELMGPAAMGAQMSRSPAKPTVGPDLLRKNVVDSPAPRRKASNLTYDQLLAVAVSLLPKSSSQTEVKVEVEETSPEKAPEGKTPEAPQDSVIEKKLKLLTQLDAARGVLQNYAPGLNRSMDEEIQTRLRKINRLQMKVVDEILGSQADLLSDVVSDLQMEKFEEAKLRLKASLKDGTPRSADRQTKDKFEVVKKIVMRLPDLSETSTRVVAASVSSIEVPANDMCSGKSNLCPAQDDSRPVVLWERPMSDTDTFDQNVSSVHKCCDCQDGAPQASPPYLHCEHRVDIYSDVAPHYHNESLLPPPLTPPRDVYYPAPTFSAQTYPLYDTNHHSPQPNLPPQLDIVSCNIAFDLEYEDSADVGVGTDTNFPDDLYDDAGEKKQDVFSETTVIIQIPEKSADAPRQVQPQTQPSPPQPQPAQAVTAPTPAVSAKVAPAAVAPVQSPPSQSTQVMMQSVEVKESSSDDRRFMKLCKDSLVKIADSVGGIVDSLSYKSSEDMPGRRRRRRRFYNEGGYYGDGEDDDDDDGFLFDDYEGDDEFYEYDAPPPPRPPRRRSRPKAPRRRSERSLSMEGVGSILGMLCRSVRTAMNESSSFMAPNNGRLMQVAERIRQLVQAVVRASREVIAARNMIQRGHKGTENIFAAESKLRNLIHLETELANELSQYRMLDPDCSRTSFQRLAQAEDKIRRLIDVETRLVAEMGAWRKGAMQLAAPSATHPGRTVYGPTGYVNTSSSTMLPHGVVTSSTSSSSAYTL